MLQYIRYIDQIVRIIKGSGYRLITEHKMQSNNQLRGVKYLHINYNKMVCACD